MQGKTALFERLAFAIKSDMHIAMKGKEKLNQIIYRPGEIGNVFPRSRAESWFWEEKDFACGEITGR